MHIRRNSTLTSTMVVQRGFALIELMVALAIMAILASVAYPSYQESIRKARRVEGRAALLQLMQQEERIYSLQNIYVAFSASSPNKEEFKWFSGDAPENSAYEIRAQACDGESIINCVRLFATPGTSKVDGHFQDSLCGELSISSTGEKVPNTVGCWR